VSECAHACARKTPEGKKMPGGAIARGKRGVFEGVNVGVRNRRKRRKGVEVEEEEEEEEEEKEAEEGYPKQSDE
jgi:hypothetical protein